jgi:hypothetical protein
MFICDGCLEKNFTNSPSFMQSYGPCEWCKVTQVCSDIPSRGLDSRARPKKAKAPATKPETKPRPTAWDKINSDDEPCEHVKEALLLSMERKVALAGRG